MNLNKARDFYSAYYEGTLEPGLKQALEAARQADPEIEQDYRQFEMLVSELPNLAVEPIEVPADLHDKISAKLDHHLWTLEQQKPKRWSWNWKVALVGGVACLAIVSAIFAIRPAEGTASEAGISLPVGATTAKFEIVDGSLGLIVNNSSPITVTITNTADGQISAQRPLAPGRLFIPLRNESDTAEVLSISFSEKEIEPLLIVLPGKATGNVRSGEGTLLDCAKAVAQTFRTPITIRNRNTNEVVRWEFSQEDTTDNLVQALVKNNINATMLDSRILVFQP
ncbi:MAG: hypothetical protein MUC92_09955 [Fimbriimonadaceae bacterium]|jgi:hypothetical protein|nr:hypothetical protein [Fimbriimonadaceae bacterium]